MKKTIIILLLLLAIIGGGLWYYNYSNTQSVLNEVIEEKGFSNLDATAEYENYYNSSILIFNIENWTGEISRANIFAVLVGYSEKINGGNFSKVYLASKGKKKFYLSGSDFKELAKNNRGLSFFGQCEKFSSTVKDLNGSAYFENTSSSWPRNMADGINNFNDLMDDWCFKDY